MTIFERIQAVLTFRNGTEIELSEHDIISASIKRQCCSDGKFEIGGVYAASLSMKCRVSGTNSFRIRGAKLVVSTKFEGIEQDFQPMGTFWITDAPKTGEIYSITAVDNVGWLDTNSYTDSQANALENFIEYFRNRYPTDATMYTWFRWLTQEMNSIISRMTGLTSILSWKDYDTTLNGRFCNQYYTDSEHPDGVELKYYIEIAGHSGNPDIPREIYKRLAEITGGFIYAHENGQLTLGQFGQAEFGIANISDAEIELDSFESSDFRVVIAQVGAGSKLTRTDEHGIIWSISDAVGTGSSPQPEDIYYYFTIDNNIFMDGFADLYIIGTGQPAELHFDTLKPIASGIFNYLYWFPDSAKIYPFRCKVHKPERFHLGQKIQIHNFESVITSIQWTFRGGTILSCGGEDSRTLSGCTRYSKADKSLMMCTVLEKRISNLENRLS